MSDQFQPYEQQAGFGSANNTEQSQQQAPQPTNTNNSKKNDELTEVIVFWEKTSAKNTTYYSGKDKHGNDYVMFNNKFKKNSNEPDWKLYKKTPKPQG